MKSSIFILLAVSVGLAQISCSSDELTSDSAFSETAQARLDVRRLMNRLQAFEDSLKQIEKGDGCDRDVDQLLDSIEELQEKIEELYDETGHGHADDLKEDHHDDHDNATLAEIEILRWLKKTYRRLMAIQVRLNQGDRFSHDPNLMKKQVMDIAHETLVEEPSIGRAFTPIRNKTKIENTPGTNEWNVEYAFRKTSSTHRLFIARIKCLQEGEAIRCEILDIVDLNTEE